MYFVPVLAAATLTAGPLAKFASTFNCEVAPTVFSSVWFAVSVSDSGIGVVGPSTIGGTSIDPLARIRNGADSPDTVCPLKMQVARARTRPKFAGMFGRIHEPSGRTRVLRFSTLTMQFSLSRGVDCADTSRGVATPTPAASTANASIRNARCDAYVRCILISC